MKLLAKMVLAVMLVTSVAQYASAIEPAKEDNIPLCIMEKLGRGIANVAFGPLEILIRPYDVAHEDGAIAALTYGVIKGVVYTVCREVVGVVDIITFPFPLPDCRFDPNDVGYGYGPIMRPAWVVDTEHNAFNFFFDNDSIATGD